MKNHPILLFTRKTLQHKALLLNQLLHMYGLMVTFLAFEAQSGVQTLIRYLKMALGQKVTAFLAHPGGRKMYYHMSKFSARCYSLLVNSHGHTGKSSPTMHYASSLCVSTSPTKIVACLRQAESSAAPER